MPRSAHPRHPLPAPSRQKGAVLIIALIMLVLITLVSVLTIRSTTTDEKIAGNSRDRDKAFQAAEAAVQNCLNQVNGAGFTGTVLTPAVGTAAPHWEVAANWATSSTNSTAVTLSSAAGLAQAPRCMVEALNSLTPVTSYRVTGRAVGGSIDSVVMLQATYSTE